MFVFFYYNLFGETSIVLRDKATFVSGGYTWAEQLRKATHRQNMYFLSRVSQKTKAPFAKSTVLNDSNHVSGDYKKDIPCFKRVIMPKSKNLNFGWNGKNTVGGRGAPVRLDARMLTRAVDILFYLLQCRDSN